MTETPHLVLNGRYRIESLIGRGGMADVYLGHDLSLDRQIAVKMLRPDLARDPQFQGRFRREAQSSASLNHPNIVGVFDTGRADVEDTQHDEVHTPYIVMEYVDGVTLRHLMHGTPKQTTGRNEPTDAEAAGDSEDARTEVHSAADDDATAVHEPADGPASEEDQQDHDVLDLGEESPETDSDAPEDLDEPLRRRIDEALGRPVGEQEAADYLSGVLGALGYSHTNGIVHRDIKPSNVMVGQNGEIKVMDFGIARALADSASTMTQTSSVVGTAQYLSPEQARGEVVDHRSDLYSAGCVLFELLANRPPFQGESPVSVAYQHVREEPPRLSDMNPQVSAAMESVVAKSLAKDASARFQTAEEFDQAITEALRGVPVEDATAALPAVGAAGARGFDDVVVPAAAPTDGPLSARTPEVPARHAAPPEEPPRRRRRGLAWLWVVVLVALVAGGSWALVRALDTARAEIPAVADMPREEAVSTLEDADLEAAVEEVPHGEVSADHAVRTDPSAGERVPQGEEITLYISSGPEELTIPEDLQGMEQDEAVQQLEELGLAVGDVEDVPHPSIEEGSVVATDPGAGEQVSGGDEVDLQVSNGMVEVPDVGLMDEDEAAGLLESDQHGLTVGSTLPWETGDYPAGTVGAAFYQGDQLEPGATVPQGATVRLSVATGSPDGAEDSDGSEDPGGSGTEETEETGDGEASDSETTEDSASPDAEESPSEETGDGEASDSETTEDSGSPDPEESPSEETTPSEESSESPSDDSPSDDASESPEGETSAAESPDEGDSSPTSEASPTEDASTTTQEETSSPETPTTQEDTSPSDTSPPETSPATQSS
ncbi:protein kinase domain-containing protein [Nesterenkonia halobia]|uniref:non-specific serine/threonine protein kinase n=1 Tax=Nesterenkonia halobia TaxID=37922 RepID=A0ABP6RH25_9MICC